MGGQRPHVEIAAIIPDGQGKIVIGKRKGKTGAGMTPMDINSLVLMQQKFCGGVAWEEQF